MKCASNIIPKVVDTFLDMCVFPISTHLFLPAWVQAILKTEGSNFFCKIKTTIKLGI
jgi:hypothetical protein